MNSIDKRSRIKHAINTVCTYKAGSADQNAVTWYIALAPTITTIGRSSYGFRNISDNLAMLSAILRASSLPSNLAADRRPGSSSK